MGKATKLIIALVVVVIVAAGAVLVVGVKKASSPSPNSNTSTNDTKKDSATTITFDGSSFEPGSLTVKKGQTVRIINQSSNTPLSFDSDPHPVHTDDADLNVGDIDPGASKTFTATQVGTFKYHNHFNPAQNGKITVTD